MNLISIRKKRRPAIALLLCTGLLGACPPDAVADAGDRLPVPEIQQSKSPVKRTLVGTVTDASTGETLIGVNVIIKGTTQGTVTDLDGKFSIEVTGKDEIEISYIGYKTQTIEVGDLGVLNVKMEGDNEVLDEVVVVGAGTQKKVSILSVMTATCSALAPLVPVNQDVWFWKVSVFWDSPENPSSAPTPKPNCSTTPLIS